MQRDVTRYVDRRTTELDQLAKRAGFDGASTAEIFQTMLSGNSFAFTIALSTSIRPLSAMRKPRIPASTARWMSSIA